MKGIVIVALIILLIIALVFFLSKRVERDEELNSQIRDSVSKSVNLTQELNNTYSRYKSREEKVETEISAGYINITKWEGEVRLSMKMPTRLNTEIKGNKTVINYSNFDSIAYMKDEDTFEWEIVLSKKPASNIFSYDIETKGLTFYYQPELTREEKKTAFRPDNVVGSYAVYHSSKANTRIKANGTREEYKTGKVFHIYRPIAIDSNNTEAWGELNVDTDSNKLTLTFPQSFLDNAVYPIIIDPTFGYTSVGGSATNFDDWGAYGLSSSTYHYTASSGDTVTQIDAYVESNGGTDTADLAIYTVSSGDPNTLQGSTHQITFSYNGGGGQWTDTGTIEEDLSDGVVYTVAIGSTSDAFDAIFYDTGGVDDQSNQNSATLGATWSEDGTDPRVMSVFATFTEGGGGGAGDPCNYTSGSGDWNVPCSSNCIIQNETNVGSNTLHLNDSGTFTMETDVYADRLIRNEACKVVNYSALKIT